MGRYFHKVQCFCFDEQRLKAHEVVDMPVLFYVDPEIEKDWRMDGMTTMTLAYTFNRMQDDDEDGVDSFSHSAPSSSHTTNPESHSSSSSSSSHPPKTA